jgi:hypothetical protein
MKFFYEIIPINEFAYTLKINGEYIIPLYQTILKLLKSSRYDSDSQTIDFSAERVIPFKQYLTAHKMTYNLCLKMIDNLTTQMTILKKMNYGFYGIDVSDILVIDDTFVFCSTQNMLPIVNDTFVFYYPMNRPYFSNPELMELTNLPSEINYKCAYYSLGLLVVFCILNQYLLVGNEIKTPKEIDIILSPINNTKIYWFLKRCFNQQIEKRGLLLI